MLENHREGLAPICEINLLRCRVLRAARVFLFTPLIIATSHRVPLWIFSRQNLIDCRHNAQYTKHEILHLSCHRPCHVFIHNHLMLNVNVCLNFRIGRAGAIGALCASRGLSQETISALCYPIMRTKDQHSHQITPTLSVAGGYQLKTKLQLDWCWLWRSLKTWLTRLLTNFKLG